MSWIKKTIMPIWIVVSSITLLLLVDFFIGSFLLPCHARLNPEVSRCKDLLRVSHPVYHHDLAKNVQVSDKWGNSYYSVCTDENGFKISCNSKNKSSKNYDIAFIGDSFTEGIGLTYEETFVGQIEQNRPDLKIANLGVSSYSPSIYYSKVKFLLEQGITFKELIVYVDISDIQDEAISYDLSEDLVVTKGSDGTPHSNLKKLARWSFPLTYFGLHKLKNLYLPPPRFPHASDFNYHLTEGFSRGAWTYNETSIEYGTLGVTGGIEQSLKSMTKLSELLKSKGIGLSVGVYPWPSQLLYDTAQSKQVRIWQDFCKTRCVRFHNSFESFFFLKDKISANKTIELYFIQGDVHYNRQGAAVIANDFLNLTEK
jgi:hypothetical protein